MSLGKETVAGKENEIVAIPRLLDLYKKLHHNH
jgi:hypothetical protein